MPKARHTSGKGDGGEPATFFESKVLNSLHSLGEDDIGESTTVAESIEADAVHAMGNGNGRETAAPPEGEPFDAGHFLGYSDGGEAATTKESIVSNARYTILHTIVGDGGGEGDGAGVLIGVITVPVSPIGHLDRLVSFRSDVVVDAIDLKVVGTRRKAAD